jgi:hypothetical protein
MSISQEQQDMQLKPDSAVDADMLAVYMRVAPPTSRRAFVRAFRMLTSDVRTLMEAGDQQRARGAVIGLVEVALAIATTTCSTTAEFEHKVLLLGSRFRSLVSSFGYAHVSSLADAAIRAERPAIAADDALSPADLEPATEGTSPDIPYERLQGYAEAADDAEALRRTMLTIGRICSDRAVLKRERRTEAVQGAERMLADMVRRLCATSTSREEDGRAKVEVLEAVRTFYEAGPDAVPMLAMIDAAIGLETGVWLASDTRH